MSENDPSCQITASRKTWSFLAAWLNPFSLKRETGARQVRDSTHELLGHIRTLATISGTDFTCPKCGNNSMQIIRDKVSILPPKNEKQENTGTTQDRHILVQCEQCGYQHAMSDLISNTDTLSISHMLYKNATSLFWTTLILFMAGTLYAVLEHAFLSFIGVIMLSVVSLFKSCCLRYQGWQYAYRRLFEVKPPIRDWLAWERKNLLSE